MSTPEQAEAHHLSEESHVTHFTYYNPTKIHWGRNQIAQLEKDCPLDAAERILLVSDPNSARISGALDAVRQQLSSRDLFLFDRVMENPSFEIVDEGAELARSQDVELVIGIGGGSAMDAAKGIAMASQQNKSIRHYFEGRALDGLPLPIICIPTTAGTGSEVTPFAVLTDNRKAVKTAYESDHLYPTLAIIDPDFCDSMPERLIIHSGLDAICHAIEAYLSTHINPTADVLALSALETAVTHLMAASRKDPRSIDKMTYAAMLSGLAISQKSTIILHILAYPLTHNHHLPHGLANATLLPSVLDFLAFEGQCHDKLQQIHGFFKQFGGISAFLADLNVPCSLKYLNIGKETLNLYADQAMKKSDIEITPAKVDKEKLVQIYLNVE